MRNTLTATVLGLICLFTSACSTHLVPLNYAGGPFTFPEGNPPANVSVGRFLDERDTDSNWLGAIRGGYGNRLKTLRTDQPTALVVRTAFSDALAARGRLAEATPASFVIEGRIQKLDCSYYFNKEAHARFEVDVLRLPSREIAHTGQYEANERRGGAGAGIFGSVEGLRQIAEQALRSAVDAALDDPSLIAVLASEDSAPAGVTEERLIELDALRKKGLLSDEEYENKRREILGGL